jgi:adenylate cyclase
LDREVPPPTNQVALVFTDIKSSTLLWELQPEDMRSAIKIHDAVMRRTLRSIGGYEVKTEGDAFMVCFQEITAALLWCFTVQLQLLEADWPGGILETEEGREIERDKKVIYRGLSVRMGIHWGTPVYERNPITKRMDYFGPVVNKASRICNAADGGQICVSSDVLGALREMPGIFNDEKTGSADMEDVTYTFNRDVQQLKRLGFHVVELGERRLKGLETPEMLSLVYPKQLSGRMEMEKADVLETAEPVASIATIKDEGQPSGTSSPFLRPESSLSMTESSALKSSSRSSSVEDIDNMDDAKQLIGNRMIDPSFVVALSSLALRMEHITMGSVHSGVVDDIYVQMGMGHPGETTTAYAQAFNKRMEEVASDEELLMLMENFVTRIEVSQDRMGYIQVGRQLMCYISIECYVIFVFAKSGQIFYCS